MNEKWRANLQSLFQWSPVSLGCCDGSMELQQFLLQLRYLLLLFADLLLQFGQLFLLLVDERAPLFRLLRQPPGFDFDRLKLFSSHFEKNYRSISSQSILMKHKPIDSSSNALQFIFWVQKDQFIYLAAYSQKLHPGVCALKNNRQFSGIYSQTINRIEFDSKKLKSSF